MEVVVAEEKKKIFRARKTMKASDRRQLESLHSTLLTAAAGSSDTSVPPLMNGTHKEEVEKVGDKEINNVSDSNSPNVSPPASPTSLSSPAPFLSLNLSPSSGSSQSPKAKDEPSPASPFYSLNFELNKMKEAEDRGGERESSSSVIDKSATLSTEVSANQEEVMAANPELEKEQAGPTATKDSAVELGKDSNKGLVQRLSTPTTDCTEPMDTDTNARAEKAPEAATTKTKERKSTKAVTSNFSQSFPSRVPSSCVDIKQEKETKDGDTDKGDNKKQDAKKTLMNESKTEPKSVKGGTKSQKTEVCPTTKPCRPSSTPPSEAVQKDKTAVPGLKRTLSEGNGDNEKDEANTKRDLKRPKMQNEELEAKLELKITAKAGAHPKLEKIVQKLVDEHLRALQLAFFDQPFKELKDRIDKIDCAAKHQTAVNTLQSKITRLAKKFGEANQELENKKKQEVAAATATAPGKMAPGKTTPGKTAPGKTAPEAKSPQVQRVLQRQLLEPQPEMPRERVAPPVGIAPALSAPKEEELAKRLAEFSEGSCREDIKLRKISSHMEKILFENCKRSSGVPRADRYASYIFRYLVPYQKYCDWVTKVNYNGLMGKEALPTNVRRAMRLYIERRFPVLSCDHWREIRDAINEILRVKRRPDFFREYDKRTSILL